MKKSATQSLVIALGALSLVAASPTILTTPARPDADLKRDADRKPLEMIDFAKVSAGETVVDFLPGGGYFTRIFSSAVGPSGHVIAYVPKVSADRFPAAVTALNTMAGELGHQNVHVAVGLGGPLANEGTVDLVWTSENYHDLHNIPGDVAGSINKAAFAALKHGGYYLVADHVAEAGSGARDTNTLHRIDPALVKSEVIAAGFSFDGESKTLANPADTHSLKVFDPAIRGHTDQFVYRFRKP